MVYASWFHRHLGYVRAVACSSLKNIDHIHRKKASQNPIIGALCTSKRIQLGIKLPQVEDYNKHDRGKRRDQVSAVVLLHAFCSCCLTWRKIDIPTILKRETIRVVNRDKHELLCLRYRQDSSSHSTSQVYSSSEPIGAALFSFSYLFPLLIWSLRYKMQDCYVMRCKDCSHKTS